MPAMFFLFLFLYSVYAGAPVAVQYAAATLLVASTIATLLAIPRRTWKQMKLEVVLTIALLVSIGLTYSTQDGSSGRTIVLMLITAGLTGAWFFALVVKGSKLANTVNTSPPSEESAG